MASSVEVKDERKGTVLGRVRVGDTKLQALERLSRAGAGGLYDREDVGLLDADQISAEGAPYVFKPSSSSSRNCNDDNKRIQDRSSGIFERRQQQVPAVPHRCEEVPTVGLDGAMVLHQRENAAEALCNVLLQSGGNLCTPVMDQCFGAGKTSLVWQFRRLVDGSKWNNFHRLRDAIYLSVRFTHDMFKDPPENTDDESSRENDL